MRPDRVSKHFGCRWLFTFMQLHQCILYRYNDRSMDQLKDDWESEDGVMVFSLGDDAMGFLFSCIQLMVDDLKMQILTF